MPYLVSLIEDMSSYLEKALQPPDLKHTLSDQYRKLEDAPPLDARVGALSRVPVCSLADNNVALLVLDLRYKFRHLAHCDTISVCPFTAFDRCPYPPSPKDLVVLPILGRRQCRER